MPARFDSVDRRRASRSSIGCAATGSSGRDADLLRGDDRDRLRDLPARGGHGGGDRSRARRTLRRDQRHYARRSPPSRRLRSTTSVTWARRWREIAFEKAGIIKPAVPVVVGDLPAEARRVIVARAQEQRAPVVDGGPPLRRARRHGRGRATLCAGDACRSLRQRAAGLNGAHQVANAIVAARTLETFAEQGQPLESHAVPMALDGRRVAGPPGMAARSRIRTQVLIDAAHNPAGARGAGRLPAPRPASHRSRCSRRHEGQGRRRASCGACAGASRRSSLRRSTRRAPCRPPISRRASRRGCPTMPGQRHRAARDAPWRDARGGAARGRGWLDLSRRPAASAAHRARAPTHVARPAELVTPTLLRYPSKALPSMI